MIVETGKSHADLDIMSALLDLEETQREINLLKAAVRLAVIPTPIPPSYLETTCSVPEYVGLVQAFIESLEYNYTGRPFFPIKRSLGTAHLHSVSNQLIREALPIQCVEAVFLGTHLTTGVTALERIPLSFKTKFLRGTVHRHIVLAVRYEGKWGAVGISRRPSLMNKDFVFDTLSDLVQNYVTSYEACYHKLLTLYIGLPLTHELGDQPIKWRASKIRVFGKDPAITRDKIEQFVDTMATLAAHFQRTARSLD